MAPSNYMNYYANSSQQPQQSQQQQQQQQQQQGYTYSNSYSNARAAPQSTAQYQPAPTATGTQDHGYPSYSRSHERYNAAQPSTSYSNRTNYDTNTLGTLSHNSVMNNETNRGPVSSTAYQNYSATTHTTEPIQSYNSLPQTAYHSATHAGYGQQQVRPDSVNSVDSSQSSLSASRTAQVPQSQAPYHQRVGSAAQLAHSPLQTQWTAHNTHQVPPVARTSDNVSKVIPHVPDQPVQSRSSRSNDTNPFPLTRQSPTEQPAAPATVDPTQVYDPYQEYQRQAMRAEVEAEKRKTVEAAEAAERAKSAQLAKKQEEEEKAARRSIQPQATAPIPITKAANPPTQKKRNRKPEGDSVNKAKGKDKDKKAASAADVDEPAQAAAMTLMQTANSAPGTDLEAEMRDLFKKMRHYNDMNPELLSRLWQQERDDHLAREAVKLVPKSPATAISTQPQEQRSSSKAIAEVQKSNSKTTSPAGKATAPRVTTDVQKPTAATSTPTTKKQTIKGTPTTIKKVTANLQPTQTPTAPPPSAPSQQKVPAPTSIASATVIPARNSGTIWPADKKQTLAGAASRLLENMPANIGKTIAAFEISLILDSNPSYIELCQSLESRSFKFDRGIFAKALLSAVPDINKAAQKPMSTMNSGSGTKHNDPGLSNHDTSPSASIINNSSSGNANTSLSNAADRLLSGGNVVETPTPTPAKAKTKDDSQKEKPSKDKPSTPRKGKKSSANTTAPAEVTGLISPLQPVNVMTDTALEGLEAVKQFVDGSWQDIPAQVSSNTPVGKTPKASRPSKASQPRPTPSVATQPVTKEDLARKRTFADLVDLTLLDSDEEPLLYPPPKRHETAYSINAEAGSLPTPPETLVGLATTAPVSGSNAVSNMQRTLASGQTVFETRPQPETQPPVAPAPVLPANHPTRNTTMVQPLDKYKAIRRSTYNPKTIARDVLLACGRHPDMRHLNAHLEALKTIFTSIDNGADLGTFRWDIADPGGPPPGSSDTLPPGLEDIDISEDADDEDDQDNDNDSVLGRATVRQTVGAGGGSDVVVSIGHVNGLNAKKARPKKPRHSEPGVRSHAEPGRLIRPRHSEGANPQVHTNSDQATTPATGVMPTSYAALRALQVADGSDTPKKKGRPVGWRKWMMKDATAYAGNGQGSKPRTPAKPSVPDPTPVYQVYKCDWKNCGAELHNLATLRKHVHKLHGKKDASDKYPCYWNECGKVRSFTENGRTSSRFVHDDFEAIENWEQHVEKRHIQPVAWELGDGPAGGISDQQDSELSDAYLSDSRGRRVTPTVIVPSLSAMAAASTPRGITNAEREARELQRIAEKRKRDMGPGIDKGGARLANDKRRHGFVDDDDMAEVVDDKD